MLSWMARSTTLEPLEALSFDDSTDCLRHVLSNHAPSTALIVCSTRERFLLSLLPLDHDENVRENSTSPDPMDSPNGDDQEEEAFQDLMVPTINLIATSKTISLSFCPTLQHLRAFLSVFRSSGIRHDSVSGDTQHRKPNLTIFGIVSLHRGTTEFSAQGLSRTFALAVDVASREGRNLSICECITESENRDEAERRALWDFQVPLLNGMVMLENDDGSRAGRQVLVRRVAQRWFHFQSSKSEASITNANEGAANDPMDI